MQPHVQGKSWPEICLARETKVPEGAARLGRPFGRLSGIPHTSSQGRSDAEKSAALPMRILIDGYNLMYARGLLGGTRRPASLHRVRTRFLNELVQALSPVDAHQTTVVFDASLAPAELPSETTHKGLTILYAVGDENADARIEILIAHHSTPKTLTVVSSDNRVRQAASRRKAKVLTSEEFLETLDEQERKSGRPAPTQPSAEAMREKVLSEEERAFWQDTFRPLEADKEMRRAQGDEVTDLTDEGIAEIERELDQEP
jgi:predicted RNA-binding protein with PIN domain